MFCPKCGASLPDGSVFCQNCGSRLSPAAQGPAPANAPIPPAPKKGHDTKFIILIIVAAVLLVAVIALALILLFTARGSVSSESSSAYSLTSQEPSSEPSSSETSSETSSEASSEASSSSSSAASSQPAYQSQAVTAKFLSNGTWLSKVKFSDGTYRYLKFTADGGCQFGWAEPGVMDDLSTFYTGNWAVTYEPNACSYTFSPEGWLVIRWSNGDSIAYKVTKHSANDITLKTGDGSDSLRFIRL